MVVSTEHANYMPFLRPQVFGCFNRNVLRTSLRKPCTKYRIFSASVIFNLFVLRFPVGV